MTIKDFIEKAIAGGWRADQRAQFIIFNDELDPGRRTQAQIGDNVFLDPLAWKAVGKVEGWDEGLFNSGGVVLDAGEWHYNMRRMIDALAEGKTIEEYLKTL